MGFSHLFYITAILLVGLACGYVLGARAGRREVREQQKRASE